MRTTIIWLARLVYVGVLVEGLVLRLRYRHLSQVADLAQHWPLYVGIVFVAISAYFVDRVVSEHAC